MLHNIAKAFSIATLLVVLVDIGTMLTWTFRYMWFSIETVPPGRLEWAFALLLMSGFALLISGVIAYETRPGKPRPSYY